jgi:hypothetical protein
LWKLVRELGTAINIELSQENKRTVMGIDPHVAGIGGSGEREDVHERIIEYSIVKVRNN